MARIDLLKEVYSKKKLINNFDFDGLFHAPISNYLIPHDIARLNYLTTSAKWNSRSKKEKFAAMDEILFPRGFKRLHSGTNRLIYKSEYDQSFVLKVAIDEIGLSDNPDELYNQTSVKPFVTKVFDITPCGTVSMVERVQAISNRYEFENIAEEIFDILQNFFVGKFVLEDIGTDFFMNWGIRDGFGPVLLDFPYIYEIDGDKLQCTNILPNGVHCNGLIDYDNGMNTLICENCGHRYTARSLSKNNRIRSIRSRIVEEETNMEREIQVSMVKDGKEFKLYNESNSIQPKRTYAKKNSSEDKLFAWVSNGKEKVTIGDMVVDKQKSNATASDSTKEISKQVKQIQDNSIYGASYGYGVPIDTAKAIAEKTQAPVVTAAQTVSSPDIVPKEEEIEVSPQQFGSINQNSEFIPQSDDIEASFAKEAQQEQDNLERDENIAKKTVVSARERATLNSYMVGQLNKFPFEDYVGPTQKQRSDIIDHLVAAVSEKFSLDPGMTIMIVTEFVDSRHKFDDSEPEPTKETDIQKAENLAQKYYGNNLYEEQDPQSVSKKSSKPRISDEY